MEKSKRMSTRNRWLTTFICLFCALNLSASVNVEYTTPDNALVFSYMRDDNTSGEAYAIDSLILEDYKYYIAKDYNSSHCGLILGKSGVYTVVIPVIAHSIKFTSTIRYCYLEANDRSYFYDIVNDEFVNDGTSYEMKLMQGKSNDHGYFVSNGKIVLFEDGNQIAAPDDNYSIESDSASQFKVNIGKQTYAMNEAYMSSVWRVNSLVHIEDSVIGNHIIKAIISDSVVVAHSPKENVNYILNLKDGGHDTLNISRYHNVRTILRTKQFLFGAVSDSLYYIYDFVNNEQYPLECGGDYSNYDEIAYLGKRNNEPLFLIGTDRIYGINGFRCFLERGLEIDQSKGVIDENVYIYFGESIGAFVKLTDLVNNKHLISIFDMDDICMNYFSVRKTQFDEEGNENYTQLDFETEIPKLNYNQKLKQHILYWISECISFSSDYKNMMVPSKHTTEYDLLEYYKSFFLADVERNNEEEMIYLGGGCESVNVEKILDTKDLVSFIFNYNNHLGGGTGHGVSYATTFDKRKNKRLNLNDVIAPEGRPFIEKYLRSIIGLIEDSLINTCAALGPQGISFVYGRHTIFGGSIATYVVPYSEIRQWLLIPYGMIENRNEKIKLTFVDSYNPDVDYEELHPAVEISPELFKQNTVKWHYNSRRDEPIEMSINGGYNKKNALRLMEVDPVKAVEIFKWLACEQGTSWNSQYYNEMLMLSEIAKAKQYRKDNKLSDAMACLEEVISANDPNFPYIAEDGKYSYVDALLEMCNIANIQQNFSLLTDCHKKISESLPSHIKNYFSHLSRDNRSKLWNYYRGWFFSDIHTAAFATNDSTLLKAAYNALLFGKGLLLNTEVAFRRHILNSGNIELYNLLNEYDNLKEKKWTYERRKDEDALNIIKNRIDDVETRLISETEYSDYLFSQSINLSQLSRCLHENEIAVEFVDVQEKADTVYYALLMRKGYKVPIIKRLFSNSQFYAICNDKKNPNGLYNLIWRPLEEETTGCHTIYFSPSGKLYTIPIEYSVVDSTKGTIMCDEYRIYRLSSTREIVLARDTTYNKADSDGMSLLVGGLDYNASSMAGKLSNETVISSAVLRGSLSRKAIARNLPGTKEEILGIAPYVRSLNSTNPVVILMDSLGTEYNFRKSVNNHVSNLHIATHGFFLTDKDLSQLDRDSYFSQIGRNIRDIEENSLVRSGLMLSGVNNVLQGKQSASDDNDGLLTTLEISTLDLKDIDMVVLSACKTGEGDVTSEGVFGLQRGFKKAGAKTLLVSLWPVDDDATKVLMVKFYEQLSKTHDKFLSLKTAQEYLRQYNNAEYSDFLYWASFVLLDGLQ